MFYGESVGDTRQMFYESWRHYREHQLLQPLEKQIVAVILAHPEDHALLEASPDQPLSFFPELGESNPFLHMGLHLAIQDQVATDKPEGMAEVYQQLLTKHADVSAVEHLIMEPLVECLWQAQSTKSMPDEKKYLRDCLTLIGRERR